LLKILKNQGRDCEKITALRGLFEKPPGLIGLGGV
jgi:hypothetical protein